jgi:hypothetical protein
MIFHSPTFAVVLVPVKDEPFQVSYFGKAEPLVRQIAVPVESAACRLPAAKNQPVEQRRSIAIGSRTEARPCVRASVRVFIIEPLISQGLYH